MAASTDLEPIALNHEKLSYYGESVEKLGQGAFGAVYKYRSPVTGSEYAVKYIQGKEYDSSFFYELMNEVVFPCSLNHPNIIPIYDVIMTNFSRAYIIMPLADMDLKTLIGTGYFKDRPDRIRDVTSQLVTAVAYLTNHNVLHRDIKPENVLCFVSSDEENDGVSELRSRSKSPLGDGASELRSRSKSPLGDGAEYTYKLADFSLAQGHECLLNTKELGMYTLWYRPPEILTDIKVYDAKADVWALGCTIYQLLGNGYAFHIDNVDGKEYFLYTQILQTMGSGSPPRSLSWEGAPLHFENLVRAMLTINPNDRISVFDAQHHPYLAGMDVVEPIPCTRRYKSLLNLLTIDDLTKYSGYALGVTLRWMTTTLTLVTRLPLLSDDFLRTDSMAKYLFLTRLSGIKSSPGNFQAHGLGALYTAINWIGPGMLVPLSILHKLVARTYSYTEALAATLMIADDADFHLLRPAPFDVLLSYIKEFIPSQDRTDLDEKIDILARTIFFYGSHVSRFVVDNKFPKMCLAEARSLDPDYQGKRYPDLQNVVKFVGGRIAPPDRAVWDLYKNE